MIANAGASSTSHAMQFDECTRVKCSDNRVTGSTHTYALRAFSGAGNTFETGNLLAGTSGRLNITEYDAFDRRRAHRDDRR